MACFDHVLIEQSTVASSRSSVTPGDALPHALPVGSARCRHPLTGARHPFYCLLLSVARGWVSVSMETHSISAPCGLHPWSDVLVGARLLPLASRVTATTAFMPTAATPPLLSVLLCLRDSCLQLLRLALASVRESHAPTACSCPFLCFFPSFDFLF